MQALDSAQIWRSAITGFRYEQALSACTGFGSNSAFRFHLIRLRFGVLRIFNDTTHECFWLRLYYMIKFGDRVLVFPMNWLLEFDECIASLVD